MTHLLPPYLGVHETGGGSHLTETAVRKWVAQVEVSADHGPSGALKSDERDELRRLRRENMRLRMEREVLKKATAFFAKEST